jgi:hypothetical protein
MTIDDSVRLFDAEIQARALRAAAKVARLIKVSPAVLQCSSHICVLLPDLSIVARISPATAENVAAGTRELHVTRYLLERGAPVVAPNEIVPSASFIEDGMAVTLWPHIGLKTGDRR